MAKSSTDIMTVWAASCAEGVRRATAWLEASLLAEIEQLPPTTAFGDGYAGILASATSGDLHAASQLLDYTARHWMTGPGEYHLLDEPVRQRERSLWRSTCLLLAAARRGRMDMLARASLERTMSYQHRCGGYFSMDPGQGHGLVEAFTTAWAGRVALRMSWYERARQAALLMTEMLYMQPDPDGRFYFVYDSTNSALVTRWREREPQARFVEYGEVAGETHQMGMVLAFLAEMHLADPGGGWERPLRGYYGLLRKWNAILRGLPSLAMVAEGLVLTAWALPDLWEDVEPRVRDSLEGVVEAQCRTGSLRPWNAGLAEAYDRGFNAMEATGWTAVALAGTAHALTAIASRSL
ncbi:MAG: hypothetical protein GXX93_11955 [Anaerolineae bacterium]|mgnify:FL=1|nr:hypothetical protein [Anaerolineae bacterium]